MWCETGLMANKKKRDLYQQVSQAISQRGTMNIYHSRFRYKDRSVRHRRVIDRFKTEGKGEILYYEVADVVGFVSRSAYYRHCACSR